MAKGRGILYETVKGFQVRDFSNSQYNEYSESPAKFKWKRIHGYKERLDRATMKFGIDLQEAVRQFYLKQHNPLDAFTELWQLRRDTTILNPVTAPGKQWISLAELNGIGTKLQLIVDGGMENEETITVSGVEINGPSAHIEAMFRKTHAANSSVKQLFDYGEKMTWEKFNEQGKGLMSALLRDAEKFPIRKPVFLDLKDQQLPVIKDPGTGVNYKSIPDIIDRDERGEFVADIKAMDKLIDDETPLTVINDSQLRTQAATTKIFRVVLWVFCRTPKSKEALTKAMILDAAKKVIAGELLNHVLLCVVRESNGLTIDAAGAFLGIPNPQELNKDWKNQTKSDAALKNIPGQVLEILKPQIEPEYKIQWLEGQMTEAHAMEAVHDQMSIIPQIQGEWFPCRCAVRWPRDSVQRCPFRGLCLKNACANPTQEQIAEWDRITDTGLVRWDAAALAGIDEE